MGRETSYRTHTNGELRLSDKEKEVKLCGWVQSNRDHGGVIFIDLRDKWGITQVVFDPKDCIEGFNEAEKLRREDVLQIEGVVRHRGDELENPKIETGQIEVVAKKLIIIAKAETPPIEVDDHKIANEETRLKFRYLDLRRPEMQKNLRIRHKASMAARKYLSEKEFTEVQTPMLIRSTPEGARDYVVPSRVHPGKFYSLPQSPQLYKQILMMAGFDRYFQFPICLRDEDLRADRQPEHTQIDMEMAFVELEDLWKMWEGLLKAIWKDSIGVELELPFERLDYRDSMERFGTDKPDLRFGLELCDVTKEIEGCEFGVFNSIVQHGGKISCICPEKDLSRKEIDELTTISSRHGAKGLAWMKVKDGKLESSITKFFSENIQKKILEKTNAKEGSTILFVADKPKIVYDVLGRLRLLLGKQLKLIDENKFKFCIVTEFPLYEWDDDTEEWIMCHHMFCQPKKECIQFLKSDPGKVICTQYDIVCNGWELGSGSIRISDPKLQEDVMSVIGYSKERAKRNFGFLLEAMKYGAPPMGGVGLGFDRICTLLIKQEDIRESIAFPKTKHAESLMDGSPTQIEENQWKELFLKTTFVPKENKE